MLQRKRGKGLENEDTRVGVCMEKASEFLSNYPSEWAMQNSGREFQEEGITSAKALKQNCLVSLGTGLCSRNRANREKWGMRSE